jgi:hypothetical protein
MPHRLHAPLQDALHMTRGDHLSEPTLNAWPVPGYVWL